VVNRLAVLGVAVIAAVVSYNHASALVRAYGESGWTGRLVPLTVEGLIYASSMTMLDSTRRRFSPSARARSVAARCWRCRDAGRESHALDGGQPGLREL